MIQIEGYVRDIDEFAEVFYESITSVPNGQLNGGVGLVGHSRTIGVGDMHWFLLHLSLEDVGGEFGGSDVHFEVVAAFFEKCRYVAISNIRESV